MTTMNLANEQFGDFSKSAMDAALKFARVSFDGAERIVALNMEAAKVSLDETSKNTKAMTSIKDAHELNSLRSKMAETGLEFVMGYSRNFYELATSTQAQYTSLIEDRVNAFQKSVSEGVDKAAKAAPAGSDVAFAAIKSAVAASTAAADTLTKAAKQVSSFADASVKAATQATSAKRK